MARMRGALALGVAGAVAGWAWTAPSGTGEFRRSPDGRWTAHAANLRRGTLHGRERAVELRVEDAAGRAVWTLRHRPSAPPPEYGDRSRPSAIRWDSASAAVTFALGGGRTLTLPVP